MAFRDTGDDKADQPEKSNTSSVETEKSNIVKADHIGKELEGGKVNEGEEDSLKSPESKKNKELKTDADIKKEQEKIGEELEGNRLKNPEKDVLEKRNRDGEVIEGKVNEVRDDKYYARNENGSYRLDAKNEKQVDWETHTTKAEHDTKDAQGNLVKKGESLNDENGFDRTKEINQNGTLKAGEVVDRYGSEQGKFLSPEGTPYEERALPYEEKSQEYHKYRVVKEIECTDGTAGGNFDQPGGGKQYKLDKPVDYYIDNGYLEEIDDDDK